MKYRTFQPLIPFIKMIRLFALLTFVLTSSLSFAQTLKGQIVDQKGLPVVGAEIYNMSNDNHTHSDDKGAFSLEDVQVQDTLKFMLLGFESLQKVVVNLEVNLNITMVDKNFTLDEVIVSPSYDALNQISKIKLQYAPVNSSQELLQNVPGLFIGQHAGGGKAEQIFLRGFDIDHGTDVNITVDGIPVNMVSHAHGQGYADLHFLIPETLDNLNFGKGPFYADKGDFATAGFVDFRTKDELESSLASFEVGQFDSYRMMGMLNLQNTAKQKSYIATEYIATQGPFESPQNFSRFNVFAKHLAELSESNQLKLTFSHFTSQWDASGQVPERAVQSGRITRFGAIDDTEGGNTSRTNFIIDYRKQLSSSSFLNSKLYYSKYDFELYSNFTFFLEDPDNADQIRQKEDRNIFGVQNSYNRIFNIGLAKALFQAGVTLRHDQVKDIELSHSANRIETLENLQLGDILQTNISAFTDLSIELDRLRINPALRLDYFQFQYDDALLGFYETQSADEFTFSPKLNIQYDYSKNQQFYIKTGKAFHSNDTRVVVQETDGNSIPAAFGLDLGHTWKPHPALFINTTLWYLYLEQEFVYVGDAGVVERSGKTRRQGVDLSLRFQPKKWMLFDVDVTYAHARSIEDAEGENFIPLVPNFTLSGSLNIDLPLGFYSGIKVRHINDRPANEDNSILAEGYTVFDMNLGYKYRKLNFNISVLNLLNTEWNETQFATESRLRDEIAPVEEIHFTPGTPFNLRAKVEYRF